MLLTLFEVVKLPEQHTIAAAPFVLTATAPPSVIKFSYFIVTKMIKPIDLWLLGINYKLTGLEQALAILINVEVFFPPNSLEFTAAAECAVSHRRKTCEQN